MLLNRLFASPAKYLGVAVCVITIISMGGCPVPQDPGTLPPEDNTTDPVDRDNPLRDDQRPIPPPPLDDDDDDAAGGGGGTPGGDSGLIDPGELTDPITVLISAPEGSDLNILPGGQASITYEVFGGDPADGAIRVRLFYDRDGVANTGDEVDLKTNLPSRGLEVFNVDLDPGIYYLGLVAGNTRETRVEYASGRLVVVGEPEVVLQEPTSDQRIRPNASVNVRFDILSLASTVSWTVFVDTNTEYDGNETDAFSGGGLGGNGTIFFSDFPPGLYYLGARVTDSTGQEKTEYFTGVTGELRKVTIDEAPTIDVVVLGRDAPESPVYNVRVTATDPEAAADITVFYDGDPSPSFNGNEAPFATAQMTTANYQNTFQLDTSGFPAGDYWIGGIVDDNVGDPQADYDVSNRITIAGPPSVSITLRSITPAVVRPDLTDVVMEFIVSDPKLALALQPNGIQIDVYADQDHDGLPDDIDGDGDPDSVYPIPDSETTAFIADTVIAYTFDSSRFVNENLLADYGNGDNGQFIFGVRATERVGNEVVAYFAPVAADAQQPSAALLDPTGDVTREKIGDLNVDIDPFDTSVATLTVWLDDDLIALEGDEGEIEVGSTEIDPDNLQPINYQLVLRDVEAGEYYIYARIMDGVVDDPFAFYAPETADQEVLDPETLYKVSIRDRTIGVYDVEIFDDDEPQGDPAYTPPPAVGVLRGIKPRDLAGHRMLGVPDLNGDGADEILLSARYGKAYNVNLGSSTGFGEAYLLYGQRITGLWSLNSVGGPSLPGMLFPGIRTVKSGETGDPLGRPDLPGTHGLVDIAVVNDMDGDELPELVFAFPRCESVSLSETNPLIAVDDLFRVPSQGGLEWNAFRPPSGPMWNAGEAQFTRGGVVIVSSHNFNLRETDVLNRRGERSIDLHEVGQLFSTMNRGIHVPYIRQVQQTNQSPLEVDCDGDGEVETTYNTFDIKWDVVFHNQAPGGFHMPWTEVKIDSATDTPLAPPARWPYQSIDDITNGVYPGVASACDFDAELSCETTNVWFDWSFAGGMSCMAPFPLGGDPSEICIAESWSTGQDIDGNMATDAFWTGFYPPSARVLDYTYGARILGQNTDDMFGTAVAHDGTWLYVAAQMHSATEEDTGVALSGSGVVYQLRTDLGDGKLQLWLEPGRQWPRPDQEDLNRYDYTLPTPHQYIVETVGYERGFVSMSDETGSQTNLPTSALAYQDTECPPPYVPVNPSPPQGWEPDPETGLPLLGPVATAAYSYVDPGPDTVYGWMGNTAQTVGPHEDSMAQFVKSVGDINDDGIEDFAVGIPQARRDFGDLFSPIVGGVFIVYNKPNPGNGYLLEQMAAPSEANFDGVWVRGSDTPIVPIGRAFAPAGDFNGDGVKDVIVGAPDNDRTIDDFGAAYVIYGSRTLQSVNDGSTLDSLVADGRAVRFVAVTADDQTGYNVSSAGDVDGDGIDDILIAAPLAEGGKGAVYLIYGSDTLFPGGTSIDLDQQIGSEVLPSVKFVGRASEANYQLGGGVDQRALFSASGPVKAYSMGVAPLGDIDGDGLQDFGIAAMNADPLGKESAGEIFVIYGKGGSQQQGE